MATYFVDPLNGNNSNDGLSFANRKLSMTAIAGSAGDSVRWIQSPDPTLVGNATFANNSALIIMAGASTTANISTCDAVWTAATNVSCTVIATAGNYKEGSGAANIFIAAAFTTGRIAFQALGATTDFSAYQQISCWYKTSTIQGSSIFYLALCSDTAGQSVINTASFGFTSTASNYHPVLMNTGGTLGTAINSVALYANADPASLTVQLDNVLACKVASSNDSLSLASLVGKNTAGEQWYPIQSINGTTLILGGPVTLTSGSANLRGYAGTSEVTSLFKREAFFTPDLTGSSQSSYGTIAFSGTSAQPVIVSGGWNSTDMTTQASGGMTWLRQGSQSNIGIGVSGRAFITISDFGFAHYYNGVYLSNSNNCTLINIWNAGMAVAGVNCDNLTANITGSTLVGTLVGNYHIVPSYQSMFKNALFHGSAVDSVLFAGDNNVIDGATIMNCAANNLNFYLSSGNVVKNAVISNAGTAGMNSTAGGKNYLYNCLVNETTEFLASANNTGLGVYSHKHDQTSNNHVIFFDGGQIASDTSNRRTASGICWALSPTSGIRGSNYPLLVTVGKKAVYANRLVTATIWAKITSTTIVGGLLCPGGQINGVLNDVRTTTVGAGGTYEQLTIQFTPTENGVVELFAFAYGGTTDTVYFDDEAINQP